MRVLLSGGRNTNNIVSAIAQKFDSSGDDIVVVDYIENIKSIFAQGNYFDKAIIVDQSMTHDGEQAEERVIRQKINDFATESSNRFRDEYYVFLTGNEDIANIIFEETMMIRGSSAIVFKPAPYGVKFFASLITADIIQIPEDLIFKPATPVAEELEAEPDEIDGLDIPDDIFESGSSGGSYMSVDDFEKIQESGDFSIEDQSEPGDDFFANFSSGIGDGNSGEGEFGVGDNFFDGFGDALTEDETESDSGEEDIGVGDSFEFPEGGSSDEDYFDIPDDILDEHAESKAPDRERIEDAKSDGFGMPESFDISEGGFGGDSSSLDAGQSGFGDAAAGLGVVQSSFGDNGFGGASDSFGDLSGGFENNTSGSNDFTLPKGDFGNGASGANTTGFDSGNSSLYGQQKRPEENNGTGDSGNGFGEDLYSTNDTNENQTFGGPNPVENETHQDDDQPSKRKLFGKKGKEQSGGTVAQASGSSSLKQLSKTLKPFATRGSSICVTGCGGQGTSTVAFNLANMVASAGYTVLLVDFDTRNHTQGFMSLNAYNSMGVEDATVITAVNSGSSIERHATVVKEGFHLLTIGMGSDSGEPEDMLNKAKISRFINTAKPAYNFVVYDIPFEYATGELEETVFLCDNLVMVVDSSTWGISKTMLSVCNLDKEEMQDIFFKKTQIIFNRQRNFKKLFGKNIRSTNDVLHEMDSMVLNLIGEDRGLYFEDMQVAGVINDDPDFEFCWFDKVQYSDTNKGKSVYGSILENIVLHKG